MPLAFPNVGIQNITMRLKRAVAVSESPFSFDQQVFEHSGARWEAEVTLPPLSYAEARSVEAFIVGLKGQSGTFTFGHPLHTTTFSGTVTGTQAIRSTSVAMGSSSSAVSAGNYFQFGDYLYITTADKAAGANNLVFEPPLRAALAGGTSPDFTLPKSLWRMSTNDISWSTDMASMYGFSFACVEAL
tara:strand:+ start:2627 stop:3187 length:561 start_codon:yes stop_codon:yes gene_type:complete